MEKTDDFEDGQTSAAAGAMSPFVIDIDGFEGPIDVLLTLSRTQKVDLTRISILQLADQYLAFVAEARSVNLELAADYLVMAAWLAYLKSRLLLPAMGGGEEPSGEEMAAALTFQLRRLESMQEAGERLMSQNRLGIDFFARGEPEKFTFTGETVYEVTLYDLLKGYGDIKRRAAGGKTLHIEAWTLYTVEDALVRLKGMLGSAPDWTILSQFLPAVPGGGLKARSALASTFVASLEMVREGRMRLRQSGIFAPIYVRAAGGGNS